MPRGGDDERATAHTDGASLSADEDAIRAQLRESGWRKKNGKEPAEASAAAGSGESRRASSRRDERSRRSSSSSNRRHESSRRSSRVAVSKSRSRSASRERRSSRSHRRHRSRSHESSSRRSARERKRRDEKGDATDTDPEAADERQRAVKEEKPDAVEDMDVDETTDGAKPPKTERSKEKKEKERERGSSAPRKSRRSSRRSRSRSESHARSSRRRRHRSRSRSPSRSRRRRGASRSRSRSRSRARRSDRSRRRRRSRSPSRSRSSSRRRHRRSSSKEKRHEAEQAPAAGPSQVAAPFASVPVAPPAQLAPPAAGVSPSITQLMQQHPTLSLQEIIAKMQASTVTMAAAAAQKPARELYVGNLPPNVTGPQLQEFLSTIIQQVGLMTQPGNPIVQTWLSADGHFAFCEMRTVEECTLALLLNQLPLLGQPLKFGRPRSYMGPPQPLPIIPDRAQTALVHLGCAPNPAYFAMTTFSTVDLGAASALPVPSIAATTTPALVIPPFETPAAPAPAATLSAAALVSLPADPTSNRLLMSNIPVVLVETQVRELVEPFGALKSFTLLKDKATSTSTGTALFEYELESVAEEALQGLNGLDIGGIPLSVRRAPQDANAALEETSDVVKLANMVSIDELKDDEEFSDLKEDVEEECKRFGKVVDLVIPRPQEGESVPGVGSIFVRFNEKAEAEAALKALSGRKFGGNIVQVTYFPLAKFKSKDFA